jgi:hypothetical protein
MAACMVSGILCVIVVALFVADSIYTVKRFTLIRYPIYEINKDRECAFPIFYKTNLVNQVF